MRGAGGREWGGGATNQCLYLTVTIIISSLTRSEES